MDRRHTNNTNDFICGYYWIFFNKNLEISLIDMFNKIKESPSSRIFFFDITSDKKYFLETIFIWSFYIIVMTGLDQDQIFKKILVVKP